MKEELFNGLPVHDAQMIDGKFSHGVNYISVVQRPATKQPVFLFSDQTSEDSEPVIEDTIHFASATEEKGLIEGVLMLADTPILREVDGKKFYLRFPAALVEKMAFKFMRNNYGQNINKEHNQEQKIHGAYVVESFLYDPKRGRTLPSHMSEEEVKPGSWIVTLLSEDKELIQQVKDKKLIGFSLEGDFGIKVNLTDDLPTLEKSIILDPNISAKDKIEHLKSIINV